MEFTKQELATIREALMFALEMSDTYYSFAPKADYNDGWKGLQTEREKMAKELLRTKVVPQ